MTGNATTARQRLAREVGAALAEGATAEGIVDLVIRSGWQPRPIPDPDSDHVEGLLDNGQRVLIEIRHGALSRVS